LPGTGVGVTVGVAVRVAVGVAVTVGVAVAVAVGVAVGVTTAGGATTLKPSDALDGNNSPVPAKLAVRVSIPVPLEVI
jgi:hypothetical protein